MFRVDVSVAVGKPVWELLRQNELLETLRRTLDSGQAEQGELRIRRALRDQVLELHSSVLIDNQGERAGALVVLSDATELRHLESIRSEFVSNVSHEMKTPVAAIKGLVESILDDPDMTDEVRGNFLERIEQQCVRVSNLVNDLLGLAAAERGLSVELSPISLGGICRGCVHNLITNAIRYTPDGGRIAVRLLPQDGKAVLEVEDDGIGIEPVHQERIFERFYRVDKARSRELGGTGLGLAIVKHLVQSMHGEIELDSNPGAGSKFRVLLPLYEG
jgi:two-component system phosphate regulon sensor histidine kinase PhoR